MNPFLTPQEIVTWFREQAVKFNTIADTVESTFLGGGLPGLNVFADNNPQLPRLNTVTAEQLRSYLSKKGGRIANLAKHFNVEERVVENVVRDPASGIRIAERGWLKLKE